MLRQGRIVQNGTAAAIFARPADSAVALSSASTTFSTDAWERLGADGNIAVGPRTLRAAAPCGCGRVAGAACLPSPRR